MPGSNEGNAASKPGKSSRDYWVKIGFLGVVLLAAAAIYFHQRKEPELKGWRTDLEAGLRQAKQNQTKVIVFFTRGPMGHTDRRMVKKCMLMERTIKALHYLGYVKVHLTMRENRRDAERFGVTDGPAVLLLDSDGNLIKKQMGFMNDLIFSREFLSVSDKQIFKSESESR